MQKEVWVTTENTLIFAEHKCEHKGTDFVINTNIIAMDNVPANQQLAPPVANNPWNRSQKLCFGIIVAIILATYVMIIVLSIVQNWKPWN